MFPLRSAIALAMSLLAVSGSAAMGDGKPVEVNVGNFARAESDVYFAKMVKEGAGLGKFFHIRSPAPIEKQDVIRMNRDTLYGSAVFDLDAGPVTIVLPDTGKRFMSAMVVSEDHYAVDVRYAPDSITVTRADVGTRYAAVLLRTFVDANNPVDIHAANALQDQVKVEQSATGTFEIPAWDPVTHKKARDALLQLAALGGGSDNRFGKPGEVDPIAWLIGTAAGWGGNPRSAALYVAEFPKDNDGKAAYTLNLKDVPVDAFWSITVYNAEGFMFENPQKAYSLNNVTAKPDADGSYTIHFGGDPASPNYLAITPGWNYLVRLYRPRKEILDGTWKVPAAQPAR